MKIKFAFFISFLIVGSILLTSCGSGGKHSKNVRVDGSSTVYPITEAVAEEFRNAQPEIRVTVGSSGTGAGFQKFARGESDISDASRPITQKEKQLCNKNSVNFKKLIVARDGISIVVNPQNDWIDTITPQELKKIWKPDSDIQKWSDIRDDWPDKEIHLFGPNTAHGTYDFFTKTIMGKSGASRSDYNAVSDYNVAVQGISTDKYAMGYFGLAYYEENQSKLKVLGLDDGQGPVDPSLETVKNGTYKPLSRELYIYVSKSATKRPAVQSFINFYLAHAGKLAKEVGYVPLANEGYKKQTASFKRFMPDSTAASMKK